MTISRAVAKPLCTAAEFALANESFPPVINSLSEKDLKARITRTRKLRDKFTDLAAKQAREIRGRAEPTRKRAATGNAGSVTKRVFFAETLERFEKRLAALESKAAKAQASTGLKKALERKKSAAGPAVSSKTAGKGMAANPNKRAKKFPNLQTMRGATRAAFSRSQAKRDTRGK